LHEIENNLTGFTGASESEFYLQLVDKTGRGNPFRLIEFAGIAFSALSLLRHVDGQGFRLITDTVGKRSRNLQAEKRIVEHFKSRTLCDRLITAGIETSVSLRITKHEGEQEARKRSPIHRQYRLLTDLPAVLLQELTNLAGIFFSVPFGVPKQVAKKFFTSL